MNPRPLLLLTAVLAASLPLQGAEKADPVLQKMREALRNSMIQLRDANARLVAAQAAQTEAEDKAKELQGRLDDLLKKSSSEKRTAEAAIQDLQVKVANGDLLNNHLNESLVKWKQGYAKLADYAKATEGKRAEYASKSILLERRLAEAQTKNREVFRLAGEVLDRYAQFGLGTAISAREPFVGITRVKFQNLLQDYQNKLADQTVREGSDAAKPAAPAPPKKVD
jgi:hypothetical protein